MATISRTYSRGEAVGWQVKIRRKGLPVFSLTFSTYGEAVEWASENEWEYIRNPQKYQGIDRLELRRKRERERKGGDGATLAQLS